MQAATLISVTEYLATSYRPDVDYLDGQLVERNVGEFDHSRLQALLFDDYLAFRIEAISGSSIPAETKRIGRMQRVYTKPSAAFWRQPERRSASTLPSSGRNPRRRLE